MKSFLAGFTISLLAATQLIAAPGPQFDLSARTGRSDARTVGWNNWEIGQEQQASRESDGVTVTLRGVGAPLEGFLHKPVLALGATLAADGVRCAGDAIEITLAGLAPGKHTLATYHGSPTGEPLDLVLQIGHTAAALSSSAGASGGKEMPGLFVEFEAADKPVTIKLTGKAPLRLNAMELDADDPSKRPMNPAPADFDGHVAAADGQVRLTWSPTQGAARYLVFHATGPDAARAKASLAVMSAATKVTEKPECALQVDGQDSVTHHAWRVRTEMPDGKHYVGNPWTFRVRHLAFPGAEGYGRFARGGRGGRVIKVTNLNDSGPGSLRAAIEAEGPRTVVFDVSGRIVLKDRLAIRNDQITLAGQTAPGKGICLSNYNLGALGAEDVVIRYLRVRPGDTSGKTLDGMGLASCDHAIVDHCSISWTQDESFSSRGALNITLQRTLISEALNIAGHKKYGEGKAHGFAASIGGDIGSFHHNLLAHCAGRNWSLAGGIDQANVHRGQLDIRNNVVYNWDYRTTDGGARLVQFVNNYYKPGPASRIMTYLNPDYENPSFGPQQYYVEGNVVEGVNKPEGPRGPFVGMNVRGQQPWPVTFDEPFFPAYVDTQPAKAAYRNVLADVGCNYPALDEHDQRVLREVRRGETTYVGSKSGKPGLPDSQEDVGGWDDYPEQHRAADYDTDNDGLPNLWETEQGLDPNEPADAQRDDNSDGYTNLEEYLNSLVK